MLESFPIAVIVATVLGLLSGLGIGGGSLLMLWLTVILHKDPTVARSINLLFFIPSALVACAIRYRKSELNLKTPTPAILAGCVCAVLGTFIGIYVDTELLKKIFGFLLIGASIREILYRPRKKERP